MKERPILFSGEMVRAILEGRKTQTRREIKLQPNQDECISDGEDAMDYVSGTYSKAGWKGEGAYFYHSDYPEEGCNEFRKCPYGKVGDRLWVRETFMYLNDDDAIYKATMTNKKGDDYSKSFGGIVSKTNWHPSIHMPRSLSRITLEIINIRVERLQDISEEDATAEGVYFYHSQSPGLEAEPYYRSLYKPNQLFKMLWDLIKGKDSWPKNPWVWVIEFKKI